jgi:hypothetical protein
MGYGFNHRYLYRSSKFVSLRKTPILACWSLGINYLAILALKFQRVIFQKKYFIDETDMAREFQNCSALFFSCANSPYSSGIVYQSLASNVPVAWLDGDSAMAFVLKREFPQGQIRRADLFRIGGLTKFVRDLESLETRAIFGNEEFDSAIVRCSCLK